MVCIVNYSLTFCFKKPIIPNTFCTILMHPKAKILLYSSNLWNFADGMLGPLFAVFAEKIGGDILDVTWAWAIYLIITGVFVILVGKYSDYYSKEKIMIAGYALTALCTFSYIFVETPLHLFIVQAILGLAVALCNPTWYALYSKYSPKDSGFTWGLADGQAKILIGLAILAGGFIVENYSFDTLFIIMGTLQVAATLYQIKILNNPGDPGMVR
ncbi:MAG: major facilitator superfamily protein [Parcubacteria group bacterium Gr01-1014_18]|nr:MAG: major facilitator superfamily protein [Parcubacteria group bacterium Greene0416_36]TSC81197.1 MAG: major facilitator superfamily protein [Parcubacteria group bacterium Gr01-1014_18]TSC99194.1 MAG: major facilitator superfamily protein [Parcubacteria group bacterium Greene1014_20]TSD07448.1 MAG: major facilitator superfamily protein [Parcubacteria group bacterium Greene0714_2]